MWPRLLFLLVAAFFILMNVLLWRAEVAGRNRAGSPIPADAVWDKVITAPDISSLEIQHQGKRIGYCRWIPFVGEKPVSQSLTGEIPEGMVRETLGYTIDFNGTLNLDEANRLRFNSDLKLGTNKVWQDFSVRVLLRRNQWELQGSAAAQKVRLSMSDGEANYERTFTFAELRQPEKLLRELGGPLVSGMLGALGLPLGAANGSSPPAGDSLQFEARNDWMAFGHARIRVYRVDMTLLNRFKAVAYISPVGELLRLELPQGVLLINDAMIGLE